MLCRSDERKKKEDAIISKTEEKLLAAFEKLKKRIDKNDGKVRHMRKPGQPDERQRAIYHHLAIDCAKLPSKATIFKKM